MHDALWDAANLSAWERRVCSRLVSYRGPLVKNPFILEAEQFLVRNLEPIVRDYSVSSPKVAIEHSLRRS